MQFGFPETSAVFGLRLVIHQHANVNRRVGKGSGVRPQRFQKKGFSTAPTLSFPVVVGNLLAEIAFSLSR
jgi:hypothetical protein